MAYSKLEFSILELWWFEWSIKQLYLIWGCNNSFRIENWNEKCVAFIIWGIFLEINNNWMYDNFDAHVISKGHFVLLALLTFIMWTKYLVYEHSSAFWWEREREWERAFEITLRHGSSLHHWWCKCYTCDMLHDVSTSIEVLHANFEVVIERR